MYIQCSRTGVLRMSSLQAPGPYLRTTGVGSKKYHPCCIKLSAQRGAAVIDPILRPLKQRCCRDNLTQPGAQLLSKV